MAYRGSSQLSLTHEPIASDKCTPHVSIYYLRISLIFTAMLVNVSLVASVITTWIFVCFPHETGIPVARTVEQLYILRNWCLVGKKENINAEGRKEGGKEERNGLLSLIYRHFSLKRLAGLGPRWSGVTFCRPPQSPAGDEHPALRHSLVALENVPHFWSQCAYLGAVQGVRGGVRSHCP